jgi:hypothetical protein
MSGLTQREILTKHEQCLREAKEACVQLAKNADPEYLFPRGHLYGNLKRALTQLEGTCRQMAAFRDDTRWLQLGFVYARAIRQVQVKFNDQKWLYFRELIALFENGLKRMDDLANRKTGKSGIIMPATYNWLMLPDHKTPQQRLADRLRNTVH